ncbi:CoA transferase [Rhodococcus sp. WS4]|nr:CoA transferase [Rhodococcus sp. WS4]
MTTEASGPLHGVRIVELAGIGPGPFAAMILADLGADVIRVDRAQPDDFLPPPGDLLRRSRPSVRLDLKSRPDVESVLDLIAGADALIEGFRPGVTERMGLGPDDCWKRNPRLVYGRMTGWGQTGPVAHTAGHDITYLALSGALHLIGREGQAPVMPANLLGDFGGGSLYLVVGILAALWEARESGEGQVVDAAIVDGAANLTTLLHGMRALGEWSTQRGTNLIDGGRPWYDVYRTSDGEWMAVGALEERFFQEFCRLLPLDTDGSDREDPSCWPELRRKIAERFAQRTRSEWTELFAETDACVQPVLSIAEAHENPHLKARGTFVDVAGVMQPAPAPRFGRTPGRVRSAPGSSELTAQEALTRWKR